MMGLSKLVACLLNISEAKNYSIVEKIARAGIIKSFTKDEKENYMRCYDDKEGRLNCDSVKDCKNIKHASNNISDELFGTNYQFQSTILNIFADPIYNRSVITIAGTLPGVERGVICACNEAFRNHKGNSLSSCSF